MDYKELVAKAIDALKLSKIHFKDTEATGAAVLTKKGSIYQGAYIGAKVGYLCRHAEETAITHAVLHEDSDIIAIAIVSKNDENTNNFCVPCGVCIELIYEYSLENNYDIEVVMANLNGKYKIKKISELIPEPWTK